MARRKKWKVDLLSGRSAALLLLAGLFLIGSVAGCVAAGLIRDTGGDLLGYVQGYLALAAEEGVSDHFLSVLWQTVRVPLLVVVLSFTALGVVGLPALFAVKGFVLCYAVAAFYRLLGPVGLVPGFVLFGLSALVWLPVLFGLGGQGLLSAYGLLRRAMGEVRYPLGYDGGFLVRCGVCAAALCLCVGIEYLAVPALLRVIAGVFLPG